MALAPQKLREILFLLLYSFDFSHTCEEELIEMVMSELAVSKSSVRLAMEKKELILAKQAEIDLLITQHAKAYNFERIPGVERNILRLACYELVFSTDIPPKVAIAEAIRLARKFATNEAANFVNAVLDAAYQQYQAPKESSHELSLSV